MLQKNRFDKEDLTKLVEPLIKDWRKVYSFVETFTKREQIEKLERLRNEICMTQKNATVSKQESKRRKDSYINNKQRKKL